MALSTTRTLLTQTGINTHQVFNVGGLDSVGIATFSNFKTGSTNIHSLGVEAAGINVLGGDTPIGSGSTIFDDGGARFVGVVTASGFSGDGSSLTGVASTDNIKTSTTANFTGGIQVGGSTTLTGALSATTATANLLVVGSAVTSNSQGIDVTGVITATTFKGDGSNLTGIDADKISEGNTKAEVIDTGNNGHFVVDIEGEERFRIDNNGRIGVGTNNPSDDLSILATPNSLVIGCKDSTRGNHVFQLLARKKSELLM